MVFRTHEFKKTDRVYQLSHNLDHLLTDLEVDGWLREFPNAPEDSSFCLIKEDLNLPNPVVFDAVGAAIENTDYPYVDVGWPIMSNRMLETLLSVGSFRYRAYPLLMIDCEVIDRDEESNPVKSEIEYDNFFAVQVLEDLDVLDLENSIYERSSKNPDVLKNIENAIFKEPQTGFPPLFSVIHFEAYLYVSAEARTALETAGIKGINFRWINGGVAGTLP
jgi:hypothetical protein